MSDPIDRLTSFGSAFDGDALPVPAADVRRRGDAIRRRTHALIATGSAAAVAVVAIPVFAFTAGSGDPDEVPPATNTPTATDSAEVAPLTRANLLTEDDAVYPYPGVAWGLDGTSAGDGQAPPNPCQASSFADLGATSVLQRAFGLYATEGGDGSDTSLNELVGEFPTEEAATDAAAEVRGWFDGCRPGGATDVSVDTFADFGVPVPGEAAINQVHYGPATAEPGSDYDVEGRTDLMWHVETGVVATGTRLAMVTVTSLVPDYDYASVETPVEMVLPAAALRLAGMAVPTPPDATDGSTDGSTDGGTGGKVPAAIPDAYPLAGGWPDPGLTEDPDNALSGPSRTLEPYERIVCGEPVPEAEPEDRMIARWQNVEDSRSRELRTYASADDAVDAVADLVAAYRACPESPEREDGYTTETEVDRLDVGGESWAILERDLLDGATSPFGSTTAIIRVGSAVLIIDAGGHAGYPDDDGRPGLDQMITDASEAISAMCTFTVDGC